MPDLARGAPRLYTIPPSAPFLTTLVRAILAGNLPCPGGAPPDPLSLPFTTIYLPTRRAARALREAFLAEAKHGALLLPRIKALGDLDEDAALILDAELASESDSDLGAPAIDPLARRLTLMRLVLAMGGRAAAASDPRALGSPIFQITPGQAAYLAADLANLLDEIEREEADLSGLAAIVPEEFAEHWQRTVAFLKVVTEHWPLHLEQNGLASPVARRNALMAEETLRLRSGSPHPVIAAGSTGTVPATARLLKAIAALPNGAVVLPGLDKQLDEESWSLLASHPEHPQAGMAELLNKVGITRAEVGYVPGSAPDAPARARLSLIGEALRPAGSTEHWQRFLAGEGPTEDSAQLAAALDGISLVEAPTAHDEAEAIALILRSAAQTPDKTAALVTPDRVLARRVAARLKRYDLTIDDSAGMPATRTVPGAFLDLVLAAIEHDFAPQALMALLKHPLTTLGRPPAEIRKAARDLELAAFRDVYLGRGLVEAKAALEAAQKYKPALTPEANRAALRLIDDLAKAFEPLLRLFKGAALYSTAMLAKAHVETAEALARDGSGEPAELWRGDAGEALAVMMAQLIEAGDHLEIGAADYPAFYRSVIAGQVVRPRAARHPRLFIWGPLEARLQQPDLVILGSLNEGVWPRHQEIGPWLSRPMRDKLKLPPPERRTGLAAHDFAQALGAREVYLTRALKVEGVPTVPSRWLQRLLALVEAAKLKPALRPAQPWAHWARQRDSVPTYEPVREPKPTPEVALRPRSLSVTRIERWIANPYEIYARHILKLRELNGLAAEPDAALRGSIVHRVLDDFAERHRDTLPADIEGELIRMADAHFDKLDRSPIVRAFWRPHFRSFARWFAATEADRRKAATCFLTEVVGKLDLDGFTLTARADRIDLIDGAATIYDFKTGSIPKPNHVDALYASQLPLEAAIAEAGGFEGLPACPVARLVYVNASGRHEGDAAADAAKENDAGTLAREARRSLAALIRHYAKHDTPYEVKRRRGAAFKYTHDPYEHLARIREWLTQETEEEFQ